MLFTQDVVPIKLGLDEKQITGEKEVHINKEKTHQTWDVYKTRVILDNVCNSWRLGADPISAMAERFFHCCLYWCHVL